MRRGMIVGGLWLAMVIAGTALAEDTPLWAGTRQMGVSGFIDDDGDDVRVSLSGRFGYFPVDDVEVGLLLGGRLVGSDQKQLTGGIYVERNFYLGTPVVPHLGLSLGTTWRDTGLETDQFAELSTWAGLRYFFIEYAAIGMQAALYVASDDVYNGNQDAIDWEIRFTTSWYY